jgi:hypothetical protein
MGDNKPRRGEDEWLNEDGTAKDPEKYKEMLRSDPERWKLVIENPETSAIILGDDIDAFQELLKSAVEVRWLFAHIKHTKGGLGVSLAS